MTSPSSTPTGAVPLFLTAHGLDERVARMVILPCEAFDNFPPGLPGRMAALAARLPGGIALAARQLRVAWLRRSPLLLGQMAKYPLPDAIVRSWTEGAIRDAAVRRDLRAYARGRFVADQLIADTEALAGFTGDVLVLWSPENKPMPPDHARALASILPSARVAEVPDAYVLSMLDQPARVADEMCGFLLKSLP